MKIKKMGERADMKITKEILTALKEAAEAVGGASSLAKRTGVDKANLSRYMNMRVNSISDDMWMKLESVLVPYLDNIPMRPRKNQCTIRNTAELREIIKDRMRDLDIDGKRLSDMLGYDSSHTVQRLLGGKLEFFPEILAAILNTLEISPDDCPMTAKERSMLPNPDYFKNGYVLSIPVPVFSTEDAASGLACQDGCVGPVMTKVNSDLPETIHLPVSERKLIPLKITGESMEPVLNDGDIVLCEPSSKPVNNKIAVCKFKDSYKRYPGGCVVKLYRRVGDTVLLTNYNGNAGDEFEANVNDLEWSMRAVRRVGSL